jgi:hypothetical protein
MNWPENDIQVGMFLELVELYIGVTEEKSTLV